MIKCWSEQHLPTAVWECSAQGRTQVEDAMQQDLSATDARNGKNAANLQGAGESKAPPAKESEPQARQPLPTQMDCGELFRSWAYPQQR